MTRVLVDLLFMTGTRGGMETYVRELYKQMPGHIEWVGLTSKELAAQGASWFPGELRPTSVKATNRFSWVAGELHAVSAAASEVDADVVHSPANIGPWHSSTPIVLTVHDLLPFRHPEWVPGPYAPLLRQLIRRSVRAAARVITVSEASRADLEDLLGVPPEQTAAIPLGAPSPTPTVIPRERCLFLAVGNRMPHKNLAALVEAVALLPAPVRPRVVFVGGGSESSAHALETLASTLGVSDNVRVLGWITDDERDDLYARATAVVMPSLFEGFGLPMLEALSRGCPVICSDLPVLREVGGDAARYVDAGNVDALAAAMSDLQSNPALALSLSSSGMARARTFSWERTARSTLEIFQELTS